MSRTLYCARCLNSFAQNAETCPNLACSAPRPARGWGRVLQPGELLDRNYRVHERIAVGGAGITYLAREIDDLDEEVGPLLAIKVLLQNDGTFLRRLANEARVIQDLDHPHIVESRGFVHRTGKPAYLVTLYESGGNLFDHVRHTGALPIPVAAGVTEQILDALMMAHRRGVIHRDLKPQNILLRQVAARSETPHILLADFGIAKVHGFMGDNLTTVGTFIGTPEFAAPEQFRGMPPKPASDVYAAAAILWFCATGKPPVRFEDRSDIVGCLSTLRQVLPPKLTDGDLELAPVVRDRLDAIFAHTLIDKADERWPIAAFLDALASIDLPEDDLADLDAPMRTPVPEALPSPEPEPALPEPAPPPAAPSKRIRLGNEPKPKAVTAPPPRAAPSSLDALFEGAVDGTVEVVNRRDTPELSLDDLFAQPTPPEPEPEPAPPAAPISTEGSILDAAWETVVAEEVAESEPSEPEPSEPATAPVDSYSWAPSAPVPIPDPLPSTDGALLELLGSCAPSAREPLLHGLSNPAGAVGSMGSGSSTAAICGACLAVAAHELGGRAAWCRGLLTHSNPDVRATAALAVGATGKAGQLTLLNRMLSDDAAIVRLAVVHALLDLGDRTSRQDLVAGWVGGLSNDPDPRVKAAVKS